MSSFEYRTIYWEGDIGPCLAALRWWVQVAADTVAEMAVTQKALRSQRLQLQTWDAEYHITIWHSLLSVGLSECQWGLINSMTLQNEILILNGALVDITLSCPWITSLRCIYTGKKVMKQRCNSLVSLAKKSLNIGVNSEHFIMDRRMLKNKGINRVKYLWEWNSNTKPCEEKLFCIFSQLIKQNEQNQMVL